MAISFKYTKRTTFDTREEAEKVLDNLNEIMMNYAIVTVADIKKLMGNNVNSTDHYFGWKDITEAEVVLTDEGYVIELPKVEKIRECLETPITGTVDKMVEHPNHYQSKKGLEVIDVMEAFTEGLTGIEAVDTSNVLRYICRWKDKNGLQDLKKCKWYLEHLINHIENKKENE